MRYFVYILQSDMDGSFYVGYSHDVSLRIERHNDGWTRSTKGKRPWRLVHFEEYASKSDAIRRERDIKRMKSRVYIEKLIQQTGT